MNTAEERAYQAGRCVPHLEGGEYCEHCCDHGHICEQDHYCTDCGKDMREELMTRHSEDAHDR